MLGLVARAAHPHARGVVVVLSRRHVRAPWVVGALGLGRRGRPRRRCRSERRCFESSRVEVAPPIVVAPSVVPVVPAELVDVIAAATATPTPIARTTARATITLFRRRISSTSFSKLLSACLETEEAPGESPGSTRKRPPRLGSSDGRPGAGSDVDLDVTQQCRRATSVVSPPTLRRHPSRCHSSRIRSLRIPSRMSRKGPVAQEPELEEPSQRSHRTLDLAAPGGAGCPRCTRDRWHARPRRSSRTCPRASSPWRWWSAPSGLRLGDLRRDGADRRGRGQGSCRRQVDGQGEPEREAQAAANARSSGRIRATSRLKHLAGSRSARRSLRKGRAAGKLASIRVSAGPRRYERARSSARPARRRSPVRARSRAPPAARSATIEAVEDAVAVCRRDPGAVVRDAEIGLPRPA